MTRRGLLLLTATLALLAGEAPALAAPADVASTRTYVQANYTLVQRAVAGLGAARSAYRNVLHRVNGECPAAAANSPQSDQSTALSNEIIGAMVIAAIRTNLPTLTAYVHAAERSHWSSPALTRAVHAYAAKLKTMSTLAPPDVCGDVRAWVASGFRTLPASTVSFDAKFVPAWVGIGLLPSQLRRYEAPAQGSVLRRSDQFETRLSEFEAEAVETYAELMNAVGVWP